MENFFNMDNRFFRGLGKLVDFFWLGLLYIIFCIPIFTFGAASSALYYTVHRQIVLNKGYVFPTFWGAFRSNFKKGSLTWLIQGGLTLLFSMDLYLTMQFLKAESKWGTLAVVFLLLLLLLMIWGIYCYAYLARFEQTCKNVWKFSALLMGANPGWSLLMPVYRVLCVILVYIFPMIIFLVPAIVAWGDHKILERIFLRYMSEEDRQREIEEALMDKR